MLSLFDAQTLFAAINTRFSDFMDGLMYMATYMGRVEVILPVLALLMLHRKYQNLWYFTTALLCNIVPLFTQKLLKAFFDRPRPLYYFYHSGWLHFDTWWDQLFYKSFPSGHTEGAFSFFCFLSLLLPNKYRWFGFVFFILAFMVGYSRVYLAAHFFADIYFGSIVGCTLTLLIYTTMLRFRQQLGMND